MRVRRQASGHSVFSRGEVTCDLSGELACAQGRRLNKSATSASRGGVTTTATRCTMHLRPPRILGGHLFGETFGGQCDPITHSTRHERRIELFARGAFAV